MYPTRLLYFISDKEFTNNIDVLDCTEIMLKPDGAHEGDFGSRKSQHLGKSEL